MRVLSLVIPLLILVVAASGQDSPHGSEFKVNCNVCHSPKGWELDREIYSFDHNTTQLALEGQHNAVNCKACHPTLVFSDAETDCFSCHTDMHSQTLGMDCARCHTPRSWIVENITEVHQQSRFPLQGPHFAAQCLDCHPSASQLSFEPVGVECMDCHMQEYQSASNPNHVLGNFSTQCTECHLMTAFSWGGAGFDHSFFPLTQGHNIFDCTQCHTGTDYSSASAECFSCHQADYNATINPNHLASDLSAECMECHTTFPGWKPAQYDHSFFPLTQGHALTDCKQCHDPGNYSNVSTDCFSCHETDYNATTNPNHLTADIDNVCMECHTTMPGWKPAEFEHSSFPLTQGHAINDCNQCHDAGNYSNVSTDCFSCHETDYNATTNPNHLSAGIDNVCMECHTTMPGWKPAEFEHSSFPLTQGHAINDCNQCHDAGNYSNVSTDCFSCHETDYNATTNPNHLSAGIDNVCMECHTTMPGWKPAIFEHSSFPLTQGHALNDCNQCHVPGDYSNVSTDCFSCHETDYNATTNPNHLSAGIDNVCMECHTTMPGWKPAIFDHNSFPLTQGHAINNCNECHVSGDYSNISTECFSCHESDYNATTNPNHLSAGIDNVCMECHTTMPGWKPAIFDHNSFPLTQGHAINNCNECHVSGDYSNISTECFSCHESDYNATTNPNHLSAGIDNVCMECHTTMPGWKPAIFDHNSFPLTQGHAINNCNECHVSGDYSNISTECFSCHESDYNATTNPNHLSAGIDNVCMECHTTMPGWKSAKFTVHDALFFPIYSGKHAGQWDSCTECHSNTANYAVFSCLDCHEHNKTSMDDKHSGENGYEYNSLACLDCHPRGSND